MRNEPGKPFPPPAFTDQGESDGFVSDLGKAEGASLRNPNKERTGSNGKNQAGTIQRHGYAVLMLFLLVSVQVEDLTQRRENNAGGHVAGRHAAGGHTAAPVPSSNFQTVKLALLREGDPCGAAPLARVDNSTSIRSVHLRLTAFRADGEGVAPLALFCRRVRALTREDVARPRQDRQQCLKPM
eukprot:6200388-Pleurochrysis_carterae.AAC.1